jgi:predicted phage terminase large subunit-like protein
LRLLARPTDEEVAQLFVDDRTGQTLLDRYTEAVLAYGELTTNYEPAPHHRTMIRFVLEGILGRRHTQILEPRGAAKTTWANTTLLCWLIGMWDVRIGLVSNTDLQALDFSRAIKNTIEQNEEHRAVFGDQVNPSKWTNKEWLRKGSSWSTSKDVSLFAVGVGGAIISKRFDIILMDDILDEENTANPDIRANVKTWFLKTLKPTLAPDGVVISIGTRWSEDDLYEHFITLIRDGGQGWRCLLVSALVEIDGELHSYWEEVWPVERLLEEKTSMGSPLFSCAYQNDISGLLEGNIFKGPFDHFDLLPEGHLYSGKMGVDLASSEKQAADFTARVTTFRDACSAGSPCTQRGEFFVMSAYRDKRESHHAEFVFDGWSAYPTISLVLIESQQFQSTLIQTVMEDYPQIPVEGKKQDVDKVTRARAVAAKYEAHKVHHHKDLRGTAFEVELLSFPKGHDDLVDAEGLSFDMVNDTFVFGSVSRAA